MAIQKNIPCCAYNDRGILLFLANMNAIPSLPSSSISVEQGYKLTRDKIDDYIDYYCPLSHTLASIYAMLFSLFGELNESLLSLNQEDLAYWLQGSGLVPMSCGDTSFDHWEVQRRMAFEEVTNSLLQRIFEFWTGFTDHLTPWDIAHALYGCGLDPVWNCQPCAGLRQLRLAVDIMIGGYPYTYLVNKEEVFGLLTFLKHAATSWSVKVYGTFAKERISIRNKG